MSATLKRITNKLGPYFYKLAEKSQDVFWIRSACFQHQLYVSPAYEKIWGHDCQTLYDTPSDWINSVVLEDRDRLRQQWMEFQANAKIGDVNIANYRITDKDGSLRWIKDIGVPIYEGSRCIGYAGVAQDITQEVLHVKELNDASRFFKFFIKKIRGVFWVKDPGGKKQIYISPGYEKIWGRTCESLYEDPKSWFDAVLPEDIENGKIDLRCFEKNSENVKRPSRYRFRIRRPDGGIRWIKDTHFPIKDEQKLIGFAGVAEDITEDVLREKELREAKENAEKANRAKSDFLAMMSHELRTPLNAILGMAQILKTSELNDEQSDQIEVITQSGQNLLSLLNDLLDFAKLEVGKLSFTEEAINIRELVEKLINDMLSQAHEKELELRLNYAYNIPPMIIGDEKRIRQILVNLISNAIKFTTNGYVQVTVSCLQKNYKEATLCFTVEDTGIGIEKSKLDTIFNRFQQINSVYQRKHDGVGLGLSIVKELVEKMGGSTAVTSEVGVGSQFSCIIPFHLQQTTMDVQQNPVEIVKHSYPTMVEKMNNTSYKMDILVVEDNLINQKISKILLEQVGCKVDIADCARAAFQKMRNHYDMIFMDIGLPDMDGFKAVEQIRRQEGPVKHIPIVAMTAHVFAHDRQRCFDVGMDEVIAKPIMRDDLIAILKRWSGRLHSGPPILRGRQVIS
ncbi:PAS domain-containing protein [Candidiatus Paracoxiella cheracis]|uniref:PAS domain-containing hybrid sensor histidine kinase/response regulator n=1 Tax=Candidiatus Paracoxiella cheracis TaxID=3405120 RepID=UPI003BF5836C